MRPLLLLGAAFHSLWYWFSGFTGIFGLPTSAMIGVTVTVVFGLVLLIYEDDLPPKIVGTMGGLVALSGWGGWMITQLLHPDVIGPSPHIYVIYLPLIASVLLVVAAVLARPEQAPEQAAD